MKKNLIFIIFLLLVGEIFGQKLPKINSGKNSNEFSSYKRSDIRINFLGLALGNPEIGMEFNFNNNSAMGLSFLIPFKEDEGFRAAMMPYYRKYFSNKVGKNF